MAQKSKAVPGSSNDSRKSGKAFKKPNGARGAKRTELTELQKILMGKGLHQKLRGVLDGKLKGVPGSRE